MNEQKKSNIKAIIVQLLIVTVIVVGYFSIDFNGLYQSLKPKTAFTVQDKNCNLKKSPCEITIEDGTKFVLEVFPKHIPLMSELKFSIKSNKTDLKGLHLNIYATNMFMGEFILPIKNIGDGNYEAIGTLPTCPVGNMKWNADIKIDKITSPIGARFQFKTDI